MFGHSIFPNQIGTHGKLTNTVYTLYRFSQKKKKKKLVYTPYKKCHSGVQRLNGLTCSTAPVLVRR